MTEELGPTADMPEFKTIPTFHKYPRIHLATTWDFENEEHIEIDLVMHPDGHVRWVQRDRTLEN